MLRLARRLPAHASRDTPRVYPAQFSLHASAQPAPIPATLPPACRPASMTRPPHGGHAPPIRLRERYAQPHHRPQAPRSHRPTPVSWKKTTSAQLSCATRPIPPTRTERVMCQTRRNPEIEDRFGLAAISIRAVKVRRVLHPADSTRSMTRQPSLHSIFVAALSAFGRPRFRPGPRRSSRVSFRAWQSPAQRARHGKKRPFVSQ